MAVSYKKTLEAAHRQGHEEEGFVCKGWHQPGIRNKDGAERPCHHRNSPKDLYGSGLPDRRYYGDCAG